MIRSRTGTALLIAFAILLAGTAQGFSQDVGRIDKDTLKAELGKPDVIVLDVRSERDWASSQAKIQGAIREDPSKVDAWKDKYPKNKKIVLYCA